MVYLKVMGEHGRIYSSPIKDGRVSMRWVGHVSKTRRGYKARIMRSCSPKELTAISTFVASINGDIPMQRA